MLTRRHIRNDQGATALLTATLSLALFGSAAIAVDLGNAFARKGDTRVQADFATLAGASHLPDQAAAVSAVAQYLVENGTRDDAGLAATDVTTMASRLADGDMANGEVEFLDRFRIRVTTPAARVNFGFAGIFADDDAPGPSGMKVASDATAILGTPRGNSVLPMYVANPSPGDPGCDFGLQTLTDPPGGHVVPAVVPTLRYDTDTNDNQLDGIIAYQGGVQVGSIDVDATDGTITLSAQKLTDALWVGFFRSDDPAAPVIEVHRSTWSSPEGEGAVTEPSGGTISVAVPTEVTEVEGLWYVRIKQTGPDKWSDKQEAQPLSIGDAPYECLGGNRDGNFGTLAMPRDTNNSSNADGWIARNIAVGLQAPLSLDLFPMDPVPWLCHGGMAEAVISDSKTNRNPGTNCLGTDTGMTHTNATPGFITGYGSEYEGLLDTGSSSEDPDGSGGCAPDGSTDALDILDRDVNNDLLTCFLTDNTTTLGDVARKGYTGGARFHPKIYESPRFAWVPVFKQETEQGSSNYHTIVDFRPAFITEQPMTATKENSAVGTSTTNGLGVVGNKLETIKIIFLNVNALPDGIASTPIGPYLGVGPEVLRLVD